MSDEHSVSRVKASAAARPRGCHTTARVVLAAQSAYYLGLGGFALLRPALFGRMAGLNGQQLLIQENGALFSVVGAVLAKGACQRSPNPGFVSLGAWTAALTALVDLRNRRRAPKAFVLDLLVQLILAVASAGARWSRPCHQP